MLIIGIIGFIYYGLMWSQAIGPPDFFIQTNKECVIQKNTTDKELNNVFEITCGIQQYFIANSEEDSTKYLDKKVHIQAIFPKNLLNTDSIQVDKQCISGKCQLIYKDGRSVYAINIQKIEIVN
ncbi:MAG: hypothetical protein ABSC49_00080 [Candidatus Microgenomates bacterium]